MCKSDQNGSAAVQEEFTERGIDELTPEQQAQAQRLVNEAVSKIRTLSVVLTDLLQVQNPGVRQNVIGLAVGNALCDVGIDLAAAAVHIPAHRDGVAHDQLKTVKESIDIQIAKLAMLYND